MWLLWGYPPVPFSGQGGYLKLIVVDLHRRLSDLLLLRDYHRWLQMHSLVMAVPDSALGHFHTQDNGVNLSFSHTHANLLRRRSQTQLSSPFPCSCTLVTPLPSIQQSKTAFFLFGKWRFQMKYRLCLAIQYTIICYWFMALLCTASQLHAPWQITVKLSNSFPETAINSGIYLQSLKLHLSFHKATQWKMHAEYLPWQQTRTLVLGIRVNSSLRR